MIKGEGVKPWSRLPSAEEIAGALCLSPAACAQIADDWKCPACGRSLRQIVRLQNGGAWVFKVVAHHDHSGLSRFGNVLICEDCNFVDAKVKTEFSNVGLNNQSWSFSVEDIRRVLQEVAPHKKHKINLAAGLVLALRRNRIWPDGIAEMLAEK